MCLTSVFHKSTPFRIWLAEGQKIIITTSVSHGQLVLRGWEATYLSDSVSWWEDWGAIINHNFHSYLNGWMDGGAVKRKDKRSNGQYKCNHGGGGDVGYGSSPIDPPSTLAPLPSSTTQRSRDNYRAEAVTLIFAFKAIAYRIGPLSERLQSNYGTCPPHPERTTAARPRQAADTESRGDPLRRASLRSDFHNECSDRGFDGNFRVFCFIILLRVERLNY